MAFKRRFTLKKRSEFVAIQSGTSVGGRFLVLCYRQKKTNTASFGYVASRRVGNSVVRNRVKRRLRSSSFYLLNGLLYDIEFDLVFIAKKRAFLCSWEELLSDMSFVLKKIGVL